MVRPSPIVAVMWLGSCRATLARIRSSTSSTVVPTYKPLATRCSMILRSGVPGTMSAGLCPYISANRSFATTTHCSASNMARPCTMFGAPHRGVGFAPSGPCLLNQQATLVLRLPLLSPGARVGRGWHRFPHLEMRRSAIAGSPRSESGAFPSRSNVVSHRATAADGAALSNFATLVPFSPGKDAPQRSAAKPLILMIVPLHAITRALFSRATFKASHTTSSRPSRSGGRLPWGVLVSVPAPQEPAPRC